MFNTLERNIITLLAQSPERSVAELFAHCSMTVSQSSFYRVVAELIEQHILVKKHQKISLNQTRVMEYLRLGAMMKTSYLQDDDYLDLQE